MVFFFQPAQLQGFAQDGVCEDALVPIAGRGFRGAGGQGRSAGLEVLLLFQMAGNLFGEQGRQLWVVRVGDEVELHGEFIPGRLDGLERLSQPFLEPALAG